MFGEIVGAVLGNQDNEKTRDHNRDMSREQRAYDKEMQEAGWAHDLDFQKQGQKNTLKQVRLGNKLDMANQKEMFDYRIEQGLEHGMTAYEMFMGPAAGAGGGTTGSGNTLGNSQTQRDALALQNKQARQENARNRQTQLLQTAMQAEASIKSSEIAANSQLVSSLGSSAMSANASKYSADQSAAASQYGADTAATTQMKVARINEQIAHKNYSLKSTELYQVTIPMAAAELKIKDYQAEKAFNEITTSSPKYQKALKLMTMSTDNSINYMLQSRFGVDVTSKKEMQSLSTKEFKNVLAVFIAAGSSINRELQGLLSLDPFGENEQFSLEPIGSKPGDVTGFNLGNYQGEYKQPFSERKKW